MTVAPWSDEEVACLRFAVLRGKSVVYVINSIDRSRSQVRRKARDLGLSFHHSTWTQAEMDVLRECAASGSIIKKTAQRLGRSALAVANKAAHIGVRFRPRGEAWSEEEVARLRELVGQGLSASKVGSDLGRTRNAVIGAAHRLGIRLNPRPEAKKKEAKEPKKQRPRIISLVRTAPAPVAAPEPTTAHAVTFMELDRHHCRWPLDQGLYCGAARGSGAYCEAHTARGTR